jgi:hypothetical protein
VLWHEPEVRRDAGGADREQGGESGEDASGK